MKSKGQVSHRSMVGAILRKDLRAFSRDRFFTLVTVLGLVAYAALFWILPGDVNETVRVGVHAPEAVASQLEAQGGDGIEFATFNSVEALRSAVRSGDSDVIAGLDLPSSFIEKASQGEQTTVQLYTTADTPESVRTAMTGFVSELANGIAGNPLPVTLEDQVLGVDRAGAQIPPREQMLPLLAFFVLMLETLALASLVAGEIRSRTVTAILATPVGLRDFLTAKAVIGTLLAFTEAALLMLILGAFGSNAPLLVVVLLLGAILVTGVGLLAGSTGRDFLGIVFTGVVLLVPLAIPAVAALFPGSASAWVMVIPTYPLVEAIIGTISEGADWGQMLPYLAALAGWCAVVLAAGMLVLGRKVRTL